MSVSITNRSIEPITLPPPFGDLLSGLGSVVYEGAAADVIARAPSIANVCTLTDFSESFPDAKILPGWKFLDEANDISGTACFGTNVVLSTSPAEVNMPTPSIENLGKIVTISRGDTADEPDFLGNGAEFAGGAPSYSFASTTGLVSFQLIASEAESPDYGWVQVALYELA